MSAAFSRSVELGLTLSKRVYYGSMDSSTVSAPLSETMTAATESYIPTAAMVYAEIYDPSIVDNPNIPSYQPYVHGRCDPPGLIPLHMNRISMEVECYLDTAFVSLRGEWYVHCVGAGRSCDCRIMVPMGEEGSVLGVEVDCPLKSYCTELTALKADEQPEKVANNEDGCLIKGHIYTLKIPQVDGGAIISVKFSWSQKLLYQDGKFILNVPFTFPSYVFPVAKKLIKKEEIAVNVNSGSGTEVLYECVSHPLKRIRQEAGIIGFSCEREVSTWSKDDLKFSYFVSSDIVAGVLLQSPSLHDHDQREMFSFYLYPQKTVDRKVFRKEVVYLVDISASMLGSPLENVKTAILNAISKLNSVDAFNIVAFNGSASSFSASMVSATKDAINKAIEWIGTNLIAEGSTDISIPLNQAIDMFSKNGDAIPIIFLITDGSVEDEKDICDSIKRQLVKGGLTSPRICTFGIGLYCNHYFLQMLAQIGRGYYDAAFAVDSIKLRLERLINDASSIILADVKIDALKELDSVEFYPFLIPDISSRCPLFISGRYCGKFPDFVEVGGILADLSDFVIHAKVQQTKDVPLDRVFARRQVNALTAHAWFSGSKSLEEKATKLSLHTGVSSEYTSVVRIETEGSRLSPESAKQEKTTNFKCQKITFLRSLGIGFGNPVATSENQPPEKAEPKLYETQEMIFKAASDWCERMLHCCCCMCCIRFCTRLNDQCAIAVTQLCSILACCGLMEICCDVCVCD